LLELAAEELDEGDARIAEAHLLLARVNGANGDYLAAEEEILAAIEIYEADVGRNSPELIDPFLALGDNYETALDYSAAIAAWGEARTIGRRNFGLLNPDQLSIINKMTAAAEELDQIDTATELQLEALVLNERIYNPDSLEAMEARLKYAAWLRRYDADIFEELRVYAEIQRTIRDHYDNDPVMITRVMRERAKSFRLSNIGDPLGIGGLHNSLELLEELPEPPPLLLAELLIDIGDWQIEFGRGFENEYLRAWELLGEVENGDELRDLWFTDLNEIDLRPISSRGLSSDPQDPRGYVVINFTVDVSGHTEDIEIAKSQPPGLKDAAARSSFNNAKFRPSILNGALVAASRIYRLDFRYQPFEEETEDD